jgi:uncharacterized protein (UPF0210 family)
MILYGRRLAFQLRPAQGNDVGKAALTVGQTFKIVYLNLSPVPENGTSTPQ